jgi:hypothetical protein
VIELNEVNKTIMIAEILSIFIGTVILAGLLAGVIISALYINVSYVPFVIFVIFLCTHLALFSKVLIDIIHRTLQPKNDESSRLFIP